MTESKLIRLGEAAKQLGISRSTLRRLVGDGKLEAYRVSNQVMVKQSDITAFLRKNRIKPKSK